LKVLQNLVKNFSLFRQNQLCEAENKQFLRKWESKKKKHTTTPAQKEGGDQCPLQWIIIHLQQASVAGQLHHSLLN
jgi:hypothetical protein